MFNSQQHNRRQRQEGSTLIEILVTLVILLFGLLGLVGVSSRSHMAELEALQRIRALQLVHDMASRINANRKAAGCYSNGTAGTELSAVAATVPDCPGGGAETTEQKALAKMDLTEWGEQLKGDDTLITISGKDKSAGALIGAVGCVQQTMEGTDSVYFISVAWQGLAKTVAPTITGAGTPCGDGSFGDAALHRVVTTKVHIGNLAGATP